MKEQHVKFVVPVGICDCTMLYHGRIGDKRIEIAGVNFPHTLIIELTEKRISKDASPEELVSLGIRLFLDVHKHPKSIYHEVALSVVWPKVIGEKRRVEVYFGVNLTPYNSEWATYWDRKRPPTSSEVVAGAKRFFQERTRESIQEWLNAAIPNWPIMMA